MTAYLGAFHCLDRGEFGARKEVLLDVVRSSARNKKLLKEKEEALAKATAAGKAATSRARARARLPAPSPPCPWPCSSAATGAWTSSCS